MSDDPAQELQVRAMSALRCRGRDIHSADPIDGTLSGIRVEIGDLVIETNDNVRLRVLVQSRVIGNLGLLVSDTGRVSFDPEARNHALELLKREQILDDIADI